MSGSRAAAADATRRAPGPGDGVPPGAVPTRVFSGIQPSGLLHIGNWLGALRNWAELSSRYDCVFCIVDHHATTVQYDPAEMQDRIFEAALGVLACGVDVERSILFVQSHVPEHTELAWVLATLTPMGELERMTQFKEKSEKFGVQAGLFIYPILQAADILLYKADAVPVGEDQAQHLELTREIARRFNRTYGETFPEPRTLLTEAPRILGLDARGKMSKTNPEQAIFLLDPPEQIRRKMANAFTDPGRQRRYDPGNPDICNVFALHHVFSTGEVIERVNRDCRSGELGCFDDKMSLAETIAAALSPIRERAEGLRADPDQVRQVLRRGAERARAIAAATMDEVRHRMGLRG
ncbi:MAG TPA: tryptophan--tRNA ligase [Gemmatimonadota bacterium]|jgi:tryptophanyl-tRNA synthetase